MTAAWNPNKAKSPPAQPSMVVAALGCGGVEKPANSLVLEIGLTRQQGAMVIDEPMRPQTSLPPEREVPPESHQEATQEAPGEVSPPRGNLPSSMVDKAVPDRLEYYLQHGWPIFPCEIGGKRPLTAHGFKDASTDHNQVRTWQKQWPGANWGVRCGNAAEGGAGLVVVDIDLKSGGLDTWEQLREEHSEPLQTVTVRTGSGGSHLYFKYPAGHMIKSGTDVLGPGIDVRADGGYVVLPPSKTKQPYIFELAPEDIPIDDLPSWMLARLDGHPKQAEVTETPTTQENDPELAPPDLSSAISMLNALKEERVNDYSQWLAVGMSLYSLGPDGLKVWDSWSQKSEKYERGKCAQKWATFTPALTDANKITFASLVSWAEEDKCQPFLRRAKKGAGPADYANALAAFKWQFALNDMNDRIYTGGALLSDIRMGVIEYGLRSYGYRSEKDTQVAILNTAHEHVFHPVKDYLNSLKWNGYTDSDSWHGVDYISTLGGHFEDKDGLFPVLIRKWLVGAVGRILGKRPGQQHPMLVLDGRQWLGKSRFVSWLGSPLAQYQIQSAINTNDKDFYILLCSKFVWEVEELGATFRKSDLESLKAFISKEVVNVRAPYGHNEITKPATASFIGTLNNSGGFLADPTGNRRFRVCTLMSINWDYDKKIDVNQVWAQAVALFKAGETWELDPETQAKMVEINSRYDVDDPLAFDIFETFNVDPEAHDKYMATAQIIYRLRQDGKLVGGNDQQASQRIANILVRRGCENGQIRVNGQAMRGWRGVCLRV